MIPQGFFLIKTMENKQIQEQVADSFKDDGIGFSVIYKGQKLHFSIKKLFLETLIRISGERSKLTVYNKQTKHNEVIQSMGQNSAIMARCVAIAVVNCREIKKPSNLGFKWPWKKSEIKPEFLNEDSLTKIFRKTLNPEELAKINTVIVAQMDSGNFFAATVSIGAIDLTSEMNETGTDHPSPFGGE